MCRGLLLHMMTHRYTTVGRTQETSMPSGGIRTHNPGSEQPQTHSLDCGGIGFIPIHSRLILLFDAILRVTLTVPLNEPQWIFTSSSSRNRINVWGRYLQIVSRNPQLFIRKTCVFSNVAVGYCALFRNKRVELMTFLITNEHKVVRLRQCFCLCWCDRQIPETGCSQPLTSDDHSCWIICLHSAHRTMSSLALCRSHTVH